MGEKINSAVKLVPDFAIDFESARGVTETLRLCLTENSNKLGKTFLYQNDKSKENISIS